MLLASDAANKEFENPKNPDRALLVTFYQRTEPHNFNVRLNEEHQFCGEVADCPHLKDADGKPIRGRSFPMPETVTEDWVHISIPGRADLDLHEPVREDHKKRFPGEWAKFQNHMTEAEQMTGTKLSDWMEGGKPVLTTHQIEALKSARFYTIEQIAGCSDGQIQALGMNGNILRQKARGYVLNQRDSVAVAQKDKEIADLKASIALQVAEAVKQAMTQAQPPVATVTKRRGRPPKVKDGADTSPAS